MTAFQFIKLIDKLSIEHKWVGDDVIIFIDRLDISDFMKELERTPDNGFSCKIKDGYIAMDANQICDYIGVEMTDVFEKEIS